MIHTTCILLTVLDCWRKQITATINSMLVMDMIMIWCCKCWNQTCSFAFAGQVELSAIGKVEVMIHLAGCMILQMYTTVIINHQLNI